MISQVSVSNMIINSSSECHFSRRVAACGDLKHVERIAIVYHGVCLALLLELLLRKTFFS